MIGYNAEKISELRNMINNNAQQCGKDIVERLHNGIIIPLSTAWYSPEAVEFFSKFRDVVKSSESAITEAYDTLRHNIQVAGDVWAEETGGEKPNLPAIDNIELDLNVTEIQSNTNGNVVIDEAQATSIASKLGEVEEGILADLKSNAGNLDAETAFIGHGQAESVENFYNKVCDAVHNMFKFLTDGEDSLQNYINRTAERYKNVSESISNGINSAE